MAGVEDKTFDILVSDIGEMRIVIRPPLPFHAEGFRIKEGCIELFGDGRALHASVAQDILDDTREIDQALLIEFPRNGGESQRETELVKDESL